MPSHPMSEALLQVASGVSALELRTLQDCRIGLLIAEGFGRLALSPEGPCDLSYPFYGTPLRPKSIITWTVRQL